MKIIRTICPLFLLAAGAAHAGPYDCLPKPVGAGIEVYTVTTDLGDASSWLCPDTWEWRLQRHVRLKSTKLDQAKIAAALTNGTTALSLANAALALETDCDAATGDLKTLCTIAAVNGPMFPIKYVTTANPGIWAYANGAIDFTQPLKAETPIPVGSRCGCGMFHQTITRVVPGGGPAGLYCAVAPGAAARCDGVK